MARDIRSKTAKEIREAKLHELGINKKRATDDEKRHRRREKNSLDHQKSKTRLGEANYEYNYQKEALYGKFVKAHGLRSLTPFGMRFFSTLPFVLIDERRGNSKKIDYLFDMSSSSASDAHEAMAIEAVPAFMWEIERNMNLSALRAYNGARALEDPSCIRAFHKLLGKNVPSKSEAKHNKYAIVKKTDFLTLDYDGVTRRGPEFKGLFLKLLKSYAQMRLLNVDPVHPNQPINYTVVLPHGGEYGIIHTVRADQDEMDLDVY